MGDSIRLQHRFVLRKNTSVTSKVGQTPKSKRPVSSDRATSQGELSLFRNDQAMLRSLQAEVQSGRVQSPSTARLRRARTLLPRPRSTCSVPTDQVRYSEPTKGILKRTRNFKMKYRKRTPCKVRISNELIIVT